MELKIKHEESLAATLQLLFHLRAYQNAMIAFMLNDYSERTGKDAGEVLADFRSTLQPNADAISAELFEKYGNIDDELDCLGVSTKTE